jgi:N-glycosylase/DNA lyase
MTLGYNKHGQPYEDLTAEIERLKEKHLQEIERVKKEADVLMMKKIIKYEEEMDQLKADLARAKEDHQYDNIVHANELKQLKK